MIYRDTAASLAQRADGNFIGVVFYVPMGSIGARWDVTSHPRLAAIKEWYEEIAPSNTLYYYLAAFDKTQSTTSPVAETIAPPKPGDPTWGAFRTLQQQGYVWRPNPFGAAPGRPTVSGALVGADRREPRWLVPALIASAFGVAWFTTSRQIKKIDREGRSRVAK